MDDQQILTLLRDKATDKAFKRLYRDFPKIENLILQKGGSKEDATDIFQEALIIVLSQGAGYQVHSYVKHWNLPVQRKPLSMER
jgi:DNA-directed RNA polymerase specialized sigma24 family protein